MLKDYKTVQYQAKEEIYLEMTRTSNGIQTVIQTYNVTGI